MMEIKSWITVWWQVVASVAALFGTGCIVHFKAFNYLKNLAESKVSKERFERELLKIENHFNGIEKKIDKIEGHIFIISGQNGQIIAQLAALKESSEQGDKHLREIMRMLPKGAYIGDKGD